MKNNFTSKKIIGSLVFPISIFLIFEIGFVLFSIGEGFNTLRLGCLFSALLGGLIPFLITLITKTDTCLYLKDRAFVLLISLILILIALGLNALFDTVNCHYFKSDFIPDNMFDMFRLRFQRCVCKITSITATYRYP